MAVKDSVKAIPIAAFNANALVTPAWKSLTPVGGLPNSCFTIIIKNLSNRAIEISYDGVNVNDYIPADSAPLQLDFQTNALPNSYIALMKTGTVISIRGAAGGAGFIYLSGYYQEDQE